MTFSTVLPCKVGPIFLKYWTAGGVISLRLFDYIQFIEKGKVIYNGDKSKLKNYSHRKMAKKYAEIISQI